MSKRRRAIQDAMSALDEEVDKGGVNSGAHVRLSKCLKTVYDAENAQKTKVIRGYLLEQLVNSPFDAISVPFKYKSIVENEAFLRELVRMKRREGTPIPQDWWVDLMEGLLPNWMLESPDDKALRSIFRATVIVLLRVRWHTLEPLMAHLNKLGIAPSELFPVNDDDDDAEWAHVWNALRADARLVRWLLKGKDKGGYSRAHVSEIQQFSFDHADKMARDDPKWLRALGLQNIQEYMGCAVTRMLGQSFKEARAMQR